MDGKKNPIFEDKKTRKKIRWIILLVIAIVSLTTGGVFAKYIASNQKRAEMESSQFHISSNYLEENKATYQVTDWGSGFDILLYNYEKENIAQISAVDMTYEVSVINATVSVTKDGVRLEADADGRYGFTKDNANGYHVLHVSPNADVQKGSVITVTVTTTAPYRKTLSADFGIQSSRQPDYTIQNQDGTVLLTVKTNDYDGDITVKWDSAKYSPDNTNTLMETWVDDNHSGVFTGKRNSTYELLFFKHTDAEYTDTGVGTEITLH